ncbi:MAG: hypothetical protein ACRDNZ_05700 [Streptosporangiaceae bacterium]
MKRIIVLVTFVVTVAAGAITAATGTLALTAPAASAQACPSGTTCGSYTISGLGARKQQVLGAGASVLDLAVAMLETDTMEASSYPYGDSKTGDSANFGIFKQNWYMLRTSCSQFEGQTAAEYNNGAVLNSNLGEDVSCINQGQSHYGLTDWFAGQRDGQSGLSDPNQSVITEYVAAVDWIESQLESSSANLSNDTRFWVDVPAI